MNASLEVLKGRSIQYEIEIVKTTVHETVVAQLRNLGLELPNLDLLEKEVSTEKELVQLKDLIKYLKTEIPSRIYGNLKEELSEIKEDLKWKKSDQGQAIIELENWVQKVRTELDMRKESSTIFIGRSFVDPLRLHVTGRVKSVDEKDMLEKSIAMLMPPVAPHYEIEITTGDHYPSK